MNGEGTLLAFLNKVRTFHTSHPHNPSTIDTLSSNQRKGFIANPPPYFFFVYLIHFPPSLSLHAMFSVCCCFFVRWLTTCTHYNKK